MLAAQCRLEQAVEKDFNSVIPVDLKVDSVPQPTTSHDSSRIALKLFNRNDLYSKFPSGEKSRPALS